jgi:hypothetical protein
MAVQRRYDEPVSGHQENEFDRIYSFYQELEKQERQARLPLLIALCSIPFILMIAAYAYEHPISWQTLTTPHEYTASPTALD